MKKILVVNGYNYGKAIEGLGEITGNTGAFLSEPEAFDLVFFTGGEDVTPELYEESSPKGYCYNNLDRDLQEIELWQLAREKGIRCIGICRGIQFINVMSGGKMMHHITGHSGCMHDMTTSLGDTMVVNSTHHQMVIPRKDHHVIGWSTQHRSKEYIGNWDLVVPKPVKEVEAVLFPNTESAGVQYHPEAMAKGCAGYNWFYDLARRMLEERDFSEIVKHYVRVPC
jgi:gamma-glutamyl-gamma-aminobutyrate hydrolase PuuD